MGEVHDPNERRNTVERNFTYHAPHGDQPERYERLRRAAKELALLILDATPPSREQSVALTHLETAAFWANASIARNEAGMPAKETQAMSEQQDPTLPQSAPLPGTTDAGPSQPQQADQASVPGEPQSDAGTPNSDPQSPQPDPWTITDTPSDVPDETVQPADSESSQE